MQRLAPFFLVLSITLWSLSVAAQEDAAPTSPPESTTGAATGDSATGDSATDDSGNAGEGDDGTASYDGVAGSETAAGDESEPAAEPQPPAQPTAAPAAEPAGRLRLAVMDVRVTAAEGEVVDPVVGESLSTVLAAELTARGGDRYEVMSRNAFRALVSQQVDAQQLGCSDPKCMTDLGEAAAADQMINTTIAQVGDEWIFTVELIDVKVGQAIRRQAIAWKGPTSGLVELVRPVVARLLDGPAAEEYAGELQLLVNESGATLHVNDKAHGETPSEVISGLPIGKHRVRLSKSGYLPFEQDVVVNRNETTLMQVNLIDESSLEPWYMKWWVWTGAGAVVIGGILIAVLAPADADTTVTVRSALPGR